MATNENNRNREYAGIDYGMGTTNRDPLTGIRFGVISQNEVLQAWCDSSESVYPDPEPIECESCGGSGTIGTDGDECECEDCGGMGEVTPDELDDCAEPIGFVYDGEGYKAECGDSGDIFITKSPYFTHCQFCSPCAPGAGYLMSPCEDGPKAYCFGHDWFEDGVAPYPVYRVDTGELVPAPKA